MFIVLSITNGPGYSEPHYDLFESFPEAVAEYIKRIGYMFDHNPYSMGSSRSGDDSEPGVYKSLFVSYDDDENEVDNYGVHMFPVESGDCVEIICDYADEVSVYKEECPEVFDEPFYQADGVEDDETGQMTIKIYIK
jgi:hypothetical protein